MSVARGALQLGLVVALVGCGSDRVEVGEFSSCRPENRDKVESFLRSSERAWHEKDYARAGHWQFIARCLQEGEQLGYESARRNAQIRWSVHQGDLVRSPDDLKSIATQSTYTEFFPSTEDEVYDSRRAIYQGPEFSALYHPLVKNSVAKIMDGFGHLYIDETVDRRGRVAAEVLEVEKPWSGWWYPFSKAELTTGAEAPLVKFDALLEMLGRTDGVHAESPGVRPDGVARFEVDIHSILPPDSWEGLCDAVAKASIAALQPTEDLVVEKRVRSFRQDLIFSKQTLIDLGSDIVQNFDQLLESMGYLPLELGDRINREQYESDDHFWDQFVATVSRAKVIKACRHDHEGVHFTLKVKRRRIVFTIAQQKALLAYAHLTYPATVYGINYDGSADFDGTYQDMKPEAFHRIVTHALGHDHMPVYVDDTAGAQVWNKPLWRYKWMIQKEDFSAHTDPRYKDIDNAYLVTAYPSYISASLSEEDANKTSSRESGPSYYYRLYVNKDVRDDQGRYLVVAGQWLDHRHDGSYCESAGVYAYERCYDSHPDTVTYLEKTGKLGSNNKVFNRHLDVVEQYFLKKRTFL